MTSISSVSSSSLAQYASLKNTQKPDTSSVVDQLFSKLDTKQQGYVDKEQLQTALTSAAGKTSGSTSNSPGSTASATDLFAKIDGDGDGKITKQELGTSLQGLMDQVDNMAARMRLQGSAGGQSAPPGNDQGFSKDELVAMAKDSSETDSKRSTFMSSIAENFAEVDGDANGKVTRDEAMAYAEATGQEMGKPSGPAGGMPPPPPGGAGGSGGASATAEADTSSSESSDPADSNGDGTVSAKEALTYLLAQLNPDEATSTAASGTASTADPSGFSDKLARQIMQLVQAYGSTSASAANDEEASVSNNLSVSA